MEDWLKSSWGNSPCRKLHRRKSRSSLSVWSPIILRPTKISCSWPSPENLTLPTQLDTKHKSEMDSLGALSGNAFDTAYMQHMIQDHRKTVADFQKQAQSGSDAALISFAQKDLPIIQQDLQLAEASAPKG